MRPTKPVIGAVPLYVVALAMAIVAGCSGADPSDGSTPRPDASSQFDAPVSDALVSDVDDDVHAHAETELDASAGRDDAQDAGDTRPTAMLGKAVFLPAAGAPPVKGDIILYNEGGGRGTLTFTGGISGLAPGKHGFHIHENGSCDHAGGHSTTGGHYDVGGAPHACPPAIARHRGDLGNLVANADGIVNVSMTGFDLRLEELVGRAFVIHEKADDCSTQPAGNSGARIACAKIEWYRP